MEIVGNHGYLRPRPHSRDPQVRRVGHAIREREQGRLNPPADATRGLPA